MIRNLVLAVLAFGLLGLGTQAMAASSVDCQSRSARYKPCLEGSWNNAHRQRDRWRQGSDRSTRRYRLDRGTDRYRIDRRRRGFDLGEHCVGGACPNKEPGGM